MNSPERIAVWCYYFPPLISVGGRRWSKFVKYFAHQNVPLIFFTENPDAYPNSQKNISNPNELPKIHQVIHIDSGYPKIINAGPENLFQKLMYRFQLRKLKNKTQGNIYDPSLFWNGNLSKIAETLKQNNVKKIIVSGAPFTYMYYALELKKNIPELKLIADFRDLWIDSQLGFGQHVKNYQSLDRFETEKKRQLKVLNEYNHIVVVSEDIKKIFHENYGVENSKITVIQNGFDLEEGIASDFILKESEKKKFLYFGTINCGQEYYMKFLMALKRLSESDQLLFSNTEFCFVGNTNIQFSRDLENLNLPQIKELPRMALKEALLHSEKYDYMLYFKLENDLENSFGTKFFDYLRFQKPIIILSPEGAVTEYIRTKKIGYVLNEKDMYISLKQLLSESNSYGEGFQLKENFKEFDIKHLSQKYIELLVSI